MAVPPDVPLLDEPVEPLVTAANERPTTKADAATVTIFLMASSTLAKVPYIVSEWVTRGPTREENGFAIVEVKDTGGGISADLQGRLFDPFFTTKVGEGTGLGLSICHNIVTAHRGRIEVESVAGSGALFRVLLPLAAGASTERDVAPRRRVSPIPPGLRRGKILVVDDDARVATALRRTLDSEHDVTVMNRAADALAAIRDGARYDVILCDLMMPAITGMELHARLAVAAPDQAECMIFVTGGAFTATARSFLQEVPNERIDKPVEPRALRALIRRTVRLLG
jgi:CheY-like chemotaxis protein